MRPCCPGRQQWEVAFKRGGGGLIFEAYPIEAVRAMEEIAVAAQQNRSLDASISSQNHTELSTEAPDAYHAIGRAAAAMSQILRSCAICVLTNSGRTAALISRDRPVAPIIALCVSAETCRRLTLYRGVTPILIPPVNSVTNLTKFVNEMLQESGIGHVGDNAIVTASHPISLDLAATWHTNIIKIVHLTKIKD